MSFWTGDEWRWSPPSVWPSRGAMQWPGDRVGTGGSHSTLSMTDEECERARRREAAKPTFGFARELDDDPVPARLRATGRYA